MTRPTFGKFRQKALKRPAVRNEYEAQRRLEEVLSGKVKPIPGEEVLAEARRLAKLGGTQSQLGSVPRRQSDK